MKKNTFYIINSITIYRLVVAPILIILIFYNQENLFKWLLAFSFFTDLIDGFLARKFKTTSIFGSRLDSIADDMTIIAAIIGLFILKYHFIKNEYLAIIILLSLFIIQTVLAIYKYKKISSFHTYAAKLAAILQGLFLISIFFMDIPSYILFYGMVVITIFDLLEEIILVIVLPEWETNVKGIYWVMKKRKRATENLFADDSDHESV